MKLYRNAGTDRRWNLSKHGLLGHKIWSPLVELFKTDQNNTFQKYHTPTSQS